MISTKNMSSNSPTYICSLNCVFQLQESLASKSKKYYQFNNLLLKYINDLFFSVMMFPRIICDKCGIHSQAHYKTIHTGTTYNFCSQNCLNLFQSEKKQKKSKSQSKNGLYNCI